jgi:hypothetical protein
LEKQKNKWRWMRNLHEQTIVTAIRRIENKSKHRGNLRFRRSQRSTMQKKRERERPNENEMDKGEDHQNHKNTRELLSINMNGDRILWLARPDRQFDRRSTRQQVSESAKHARWQRNGCSSKWPSHKRRTTFLAEIWWFWKWSH